jgi:V8-like Glu-specific endopeptidase
MKGYLEKDRFIDPMTVLSGAFERAKLENFAEPYNLPKSWIAKEKSLNQETPFNFVSTNDIIGGNSGSPILNQKGELVGLIFDGNAPSISWSFKFDDQEGRATSVHSRAILETLHHIYEADHLIHEIAPAYLPPGVNQLPLQ